MQKIDFVSMMKVTTSDEICSKHGCHLMGINKHEPICPKCEQEQVNREKEELAKQFRIENIKSVLRRKSLVDDNDTFDVSFNAYQAKNGSLEESVKRQARMIAGEYFRNPAANFNTLFYGLPGSGKTHLAMSILKAVNDNAEPPQKCLFINMETLFTKIKSSFNNPSALWTEDYAIRLITDADLVVLDDLGSESAMRDQSEATEFTQRILKGILNKQKRIIVTTNLTNQQLSHVYNPKIVSRLLRGSKGHTINFTKIRDKRTGL